MIRLFVPDPLSPEAEIVLPDDQAHYLVAVMRQGVGDTVMLFNGCDGEWRASVAAVSKRGCRLKVETRTRLQASTPDLELIIALVKRARLETIVEKATELGARRVSLVVTQRTNADHARVDRLQAIAREAAEQTGRLDVPAIAEPRALADLLAGWDHGRTLMFCDEAGDEPGELWGGSSGRARPVLDALDRDAAGPPRPGAILIGPEGGFDPQERTHLRALPFVVAVTLGPRILRADTAAIAAMTLWQAALGDWRPAAAALS